MVEIISLPMCNWPLFIEVCQEHLGYSPTRGLDESVCPYDIKHPLAWLSCLPMNNKPMLNMQSDFASYHYHVSVVTDIKTGLIIGSLGSIPMSVLTYQQLTLISGSLSQWKELFKSSKKIFIEEAKNAFKACNLGAAI